MKAWGYIIGLSLSMGGSVFSQNLSDRVNVEKRSYLKQPKIRNAELYQTEKAKLLAKRRASLITELRQAMKAIKDKEQFNEFQHRLANLYLEEYKYQSANGLMGKDFLQKAYGIFKELASTQAQSKRADEIFFQLGQIALEFGQTDKAQDAFAVVADRFPQSPFVDESTLQVADYAFDRSDFKKSITHFSKLAEKKESPLYLYAHYKLAWAHYNLGKPQLTLEHFQTIAREDGSLSSHQSLALKKETIRDICLPLADLKRYQEGYAFYLEQEDTYLRPGLECLASLAQERGDWQAAIELNHKLLNLDPHSAKNPDYSLALVEIYRKQDKREELYNNLNEALNTYLGDSTWREIFSSDTKTFTSHRTNFETVCRKLALETHSVAQKTKNPELYSHARKLYQLYLTHFSTFVDAPQMQFYFAEILYKQKDYSNAAPAYLGVYQNPATSGDLKKEALFNSLLSNSNLINEERKKSGQREFSAKTHEKRVSQEEDTFTEYTESETAFIQQAQAFYSDYKKDEKAPLFLFQVGYLRYLHHDNEKAVQDFWTLINTYPSLSQSRSAGRLILDIYNQQKQFTYLAQTAKKLLAVPGYGDPEYKKELLDVQRKSELKLIADLEAKEKYKEAAHAYLSFYTNQGMQDLALGEKALFNSGVCFQKANLNKDALTTQEAFLKKFPRSEFRRDLLLQVAKAFEASAQFEKAALYFELFQKENPRHVQASNALRFAGLYYWGSGNRNKAEETLLSRYQVYPQDKSGAERDLIDFFEAEELLDKQLAFWIKKRTERGISYSQLVEALLKISHLKEQLGDKSFTQSYAEAELVATKHSKALMETTMGNQLLGQIFIKSSERIENQFRGIRLSSAGKDIERALSHKMKALKMMEDEFSRIAKLGGDAGLGATYKIAWAYLSFSEEISEAPIPNELNSEQIDTYRNELNQRLIHPFKTKAMTLANLCLEKAHEFSLISPWVDKCYSLASRLDSEKYPNLATFTVAPYFPSFLPLGEGAEQTSKNSLYQATSLFKESIKNRFMDLGDQGSTVRVLSFQPLWEQRKSMFLKNQKEASPQSETEWWSYLNSHRITLPSRAIKELKAFLAEHPENPAFHNLLALAQMDDGSLIPAKITLLSLLARGLDGAEIYNNLGVIEAQRGRLSDALIYFAKAAEKGSAEAHLNQGLMALSVRNGVTAKLFFEKSLEMGAIDLARISSGIAKIQSGDLETGREELSSLQESYPNNPLLKAQVEALRGAPQEEAREISSEALPD